MESELPTLPKKIFAVGLKTSNDKSTKLSLACGYRVMCCSNGMLFGDFIPLAVKHSASLDIDDALALGIDRIRRRFGNVRLEIDDKKASELTDRQAEHIIYQAFAFGKIPISLFRTVTLLNQATRNLRQELFGVSKTHLPKALKSSNRYNNSRLPRNSPNFCSNIETNFYLAKFPTRHESQHPTLCRGVLFYQARSKNIYKLDNPLNLQ